MDEILMSGCDCGSCPGCEDKDVKKGAGVVADDAAEDSEEIDLDETDLDLGDDDDISDGDE